VLGEDDCSKAAQTFQCGQEKDPALVGAIRGRLSDCKKLKICKQKL
jgi:hypothetical protein